MNTNEFFDACYDDPTFVGVIYQHRVRMPDDSICYVGNGQLLPNGAEVDVVDHILSMESELFVITPVYKKEHNHA